MINVGLLSEGNTDIAFYEEFLKNFLIKAGVTDELSFFPKEADTSIINHIEENTVYFFSKPIVDFAFYITDYDKGISVKKIEEWINQKKEEGKDYPIIFIYPQPCMEGWFCLEQDALKKIFNLNPEETITCEPDPKHYLEQLIGRQDDYTKLKTEYYKDIGKIFNPDKLKNVSELKKLKNDLTVILHQQSLI